MVDATSPAPHERAEREKVAAGIIGAAGCMSALLISGWFGEPISFAVGLAIAVAGGALGGAITYGSRDERIANISAGIVAALAIVIATAVYIERKHSFIRIELLLPMAIGAAIGYGALLVLRKLPSPGLRLAAAVVLPIAMLALVALAVVAPTPAPPPPPTTSATHGPKIEIQGRDALRRQLGPKALTLFSKVDILNSMFDVFGAKVLNDPAGQKAAADVRAAAADLREDIDRRIAAGAPASDFADFTAIERRIVATLGPAPAAP